MNGTVCKEIVVQVVAIGLLVFASGCVGSSPSIHDVVKTISAVPVGVNRDEVRKVLFENYSKLPKAVRRDYEPLCTSHKLTARIINANRHYLDFYSKEGLYNYIYPADLFEKLSPDGYCDIISDVKESVLDRTADIDIYYDSSNNYLGFTATAYRKSPRK